jgi:hypothetical protein
MDRAMMRQTKAIKITADLAHTIQRCNRSCTPHDGQK